MKAAVLWLGLLSSSPALAAEASAEALAAQARTLAAARAYDEALALVDRAVALAPADLDLRALRVRLHAWKGDHRAAQAELDAAPPGALSHQELSRLSGDVPFWAGDDRLAAQQYDAHLARHPSDVEALRPRGIARFRSGDVAGGRSDLAARCEAAPADAQACAARSELERSHPRGLVFAQGGYSASADVAGGLTGRLRLEHRAARSLFLHAQSELLTRDYGGGPLTDLMLSAGARILLSARAWVTVGGGATVKPDFLPLWTAEVEPALSLGRLELSARYFRLQFQNGGAHVLSPAVHFDGGRWRLFGRYYLGRDDLRGFGHSGFARLSAAPLEPVWVHLAAGGGNRAEYLEPRALAFERSLFVRGAAEWLLSDRLALLGEYEWRDESVGRLVITRHEALLGVRWRL